MVQDTGDAADAARAATPAEPSPAVSGKAGIPIADYLDQAIAGFDGDPPDSDFQRGYLEALKTVRQEADLFAVPDWIDDCFASIKELADAAETLLIWQSAKDGLDRLRSPIIPEQVSA